MKKIIIIALLAIILIVSWYFLIYKPKNANEGKSCKTATGLSGKIENGVCKAIPVGSETFYN